MTARSPITTHVLDTSRGCPASGIVIQLDRLNSAGQWEELAQGTTDEDGRIANLVEPTGFSSGRFRLTFGTGDYFSSLGSSSFYPQVAVEFETTAASDHYHVPLLLSPFGYSTYRGS